MAGVGHREKSGKIVVLNENNWETVKDLPLN